MDDFDHLAKRVEDKGKIWTQNDIDEYFKISGKEPDSKGYCQLPTNRVKNSVVFFESEKELISYENGVAVPKDFLEYEAALLGFLDYVDLVAANPDYDHPLEGMKELANTNADVCDRIDEIDRYVEAGGTFHKRELKRIQKDLEGKLEVLQGPIRKMGKLIRS